MAGSTRVLSRRQALQRLAWGATALAVPAVRAQAPVRPNVVLIVADDLGSRDVGCFGADDLKTPHLDDLARRGVRLTSFYAPAPLCTASRAGLMTGRHFQRCLVPGKGIAPDETTIAETFRAGGYRTGFFGKWHLGGFDDWDPLSQGFDEFLGHLVGAIDNYSHYNYWGGAPRHALWKKRQPYREDGVFFPDILARECGQFVERNRSRPFFLCASFNMPHYPLQPEKRFVDENLSLSSANRRAYAATVQSMDDKIGQILDAVDQASLTEKTIVIFLSDHGHSEEKAAGSGGGWSGPHRGHKGTLWEGGIRVPCIASWPARFPAGKIRQQISSGLDWFPTLCQLCGIQAGTVDGNNLTGVLIDDAPSPHQALHWMLGSHWAVRQGRWKLSATPEGVHLSDLFEDSGEQRNVAKVYPDQLRRMRESHSQWLTEGIKPIYNVSYQ